MAKTDSRLLAALRAKLGTESKPVSSQAVQQRRSRLQALVPMSTDIATYVVAQRAGIRIDRYIKDEVVLSAVADADARLRAIEGARTPDRRQAPPAKERRPQPTLKEVSLDGVRLPSAVLSDRHLKDADRMAQVYPILYVFENSIREFIDGHLTRAYGEDWWDEPKLVSVDVRRNVEIARKAESENRWHSSRKARPIYYTMLGDLAKIVQSERGWKVFKPPIFPRPTWFPELVQSAEVSRNIVAHMNPVALTDVKRLRMRLTEWVEQTAGHWPASS